MARTVADHLVDTLAKAGVRQIYGLVGDSLNPVTDALRRNGTIKWNDVRHEESGAYAAGMGGLVRDCSSFAKLSNQGELKVSTDYADNAESTISS
jgi:TPP-dependent 2-oxoacid decarboxylase